MLGDMQDCSQSASQFKESCMHASVARRKDLNYEKALELAQAIKSAVKNTLQHQWKFITLWTGQITYT